MSYGAGIRSLRDSSIGTLWILDPTAGLIVVLRSASFFPVMAVCGLFYKGIIKFFVILISRDLAQSHSARGAIAACSVSSG